MNRQRIQQRIRTDSGYPSTVVEVLDDNMRFKPETLRVMRAFVKLAPWSGSFEERARKFRWLNQQLADICCIPAPTLDFGRIDGSSRASHYVPGQHQIVLTGRLSVVTFLHEFAHSMGHGEQRATRWSVNLFRRSFPQQFARLIHRGHMLLRPEDAADLAGTDSAP